MTLCQRLCEWFANTLVGEIWRAGLCKHRLEVELKLSIVRGMLSHRDQRLTLINDSSVCLVCDWV